jgi:hypothetical protein
MASLTIEIAAPPLAITTFNLPNGMVGQPYYFQLQASGGTLPYFWSIISGSLAPGLQLDPLTGKISGTPIQPGTSQVTIQVMDSSAPQSLAKLTIGRAAPGEPTSTSN